jgi:hypothetical protein
VPSAELAARRPELERAVREAAARVGDLAREAVPGGPS